MESEDSRPGSSLSNSSSNSSENSSQYSPTPTNENRDSVFPPSNSDGNYHVDDNTTENAPRSYNEDIRSPQSLSNSDSDITSSSSSINENTKKSENFVDAMNAENPDLSNNEGGHHQNFTSCNQSPDSPERSLRNSRNSSVSSNRSRSNSREQHNGEDMGINISHEDLSDVSDMEIDKRTTTFHNKLGREGSNGISSPMTNEGDQFLLNEDYRLEKDINQGKEITDLRQKLENKKNQGKRSENVGVETHETETNNDNCVIKKMDKSIDDLVKAQDDDDLDFEAEEGECQDIPKECEKSPREESADDCKIIKNEVKCPLEELEEGEVSDEDEKRPEEMEPKPVCRFYTRGQCTWGMSCRFLHPGVTDKGNYTMFDLVRPVSVPQTSASGSRNPNFTSDYHDFRNERPPIHHRAGVHHPISLYQTHHEPRPIVSDGPIVVESAWERGLRTAKEMMRKANKRKEQDMDFEDKKMNLTLSPDELEKDSYYLKERETQDPVPSFVRHGVYQEVPNVPYSPAERFSRGPTIPTYDDVDPYGRTTRYRELPPHRMPQYEDERRIRPTREVIVQRVEPVGRGDEWNDPWMRSKSPGAARGTSRDRNEKRRRDRRSYSSNSSYSSSTSSQSDSSSESSNSPSSIDRRRRYKTSALMHKPVRSARSPSATRRSRRSPAIRHSPPATKRRNNTSLSPVLEKRNVYSPPHKRKKFSPVSKKSINEIPNAKRHRTSSSSGSDSSDSSASDSESETGSSSSGSSSLSKDRSPIKRARIQEKMLSDRKLKKIEPTKKRSPISIEIKKPPVVGASALSSPPHLATIEKKSRREELLKQLRAVEDAIAKKRSKLT